jgi:hypothetical protein
MQQPRHELRLHIAVYTSPDLIWTVLQVHLILGLNVPLSAKRNLFCKSLVTLCSCHAERTLCHCLDTVKYLREQPTYSNFKEAFVILKMKTSVNLDFV